MKEAIALCLCAALWALPAAADETATVAGVTIEVGEDGRPLPLTAAKRRELVENLRASFAALGVHAHSGPERVHASGYRSQTIGLDKTLITVARERADGSLELTCVQGAEKAAEILVEDE